jgi:hypothetical protein
LGNTITYGASQDRRSNPSLLGQFLWKRLGLYLEESSEQFGRSYVPSEINQSAELARSIPRLGANCPDESLFSAPQCWIGRGYQEFGQAITLS